MWLPNARATLENGQESTENSSGNNETTGNVKKSLPTEVGIYTVTYVVKDSWGREAKASRTLTIQKGLERHELIFGGRNGREQDLPAFKLKLVEENNKPKINFEALIDAQILATAKSNYDYYGVEIFRDTENTGVRNRIVEVKVGVQDNPSNESFNMRRLVNQDLKYGDKIKIYARQTPNFGIKGEILGDVKEDYSDGVQNKMNLDYVQFEITKNGLIAIYNDTDLNDSIKNVITNIDRGGLQPFKIKFDISDNGSNTNNIGKIIVEGYSEPIIYEDRTNTLTIKLVDRKSVV